MSDKSEELGRSITQAACFLGQIYQDTSQMLAALDGLMADRRWQPTEKTRISWALSNGMDPNKWLLHYLFRWYVPTGSLESIQTLVAFVIQFVPLRFFDQAIVLGTAGRFALPARYEDLKNQWTDINPVVEALAEKPGPRHLTAQEISTLLPSASRVTGMVIPLCQLTGAETLQSLCVDPIIASLATLEN